MPWDHDPAMAGWRRALKGWATELEWKQSTVMDAWLECANDTWVRWSSVKAVEVRPQVHTVYYDIVLATDDERYIYATKESRNEARAAAAELLQQLSHDYRQSA